MSIIPNVGIYEISLFKLREKDVLHDGEMIIRQIKMKCEHKAVEA